MIVSVTFKINNKLLAPQHLPFRVSKPIWELFVLDAIYFPCLHLHAAPPFVLANKYIQTAACQDKAAFR